MPISRRDFCERLIPGGLLLAASPGAAACVQQAADRTLAPAPTGSHIGSLYPFVQGQADHSKLELSFLQPEFKTLAEWQPIARARIFDHLFFAPPPVAPQAQLVRRTDRADYIEEYLTFQTAPDIRVPGYVLIPKNARLPAPGIVALHSHDGVYLWGKEKIVAIEQEHPWLTDYKRDAYGGTSITAELVRQGYVVVTIDALYWGERRMLLDDDSAAYRERPLSMTEQEIRAFNQRAQQNEQLLARSLFTAGITWPGVLLWDDLRTVDYLASRPEVDRNRIGCVGLSMGGYRSYSLAALDPRIKAAVDVGWMTSFAAQIKQHVINTIGLSFHINGLYRYLDFPDFAALIAPRALMVINGSQDQLFALDGVKTAFDKIARCYAKAGAPDRQRCRMYDAPHQFNREMQAEAWDWLKKWV